MSMGKPFSFRMNKQASHTLEKGFPENNLNYLILLSRIYFKKLFKEFFVKSVRVVWNFVEKFSVYGDSFVRKQFEVVRCFHVFKHIRHNELCAEK